jgi:hypothetical protein
MTVQSHPDKADDLPGESEAAPEVSDQLTQGELKASVPAGRTGMLRRVGWTVAALVGALGLYVLLYSISVHAVAPDSDGASVVLEGQAMLHGNFLLNGWSLSFDSFWLIDALWNLLAVLVYGLHPAVLHAVPAAIAVATIALGVVMAVEERRRVPAVAAALTVLAILGLPSQALSHFFLRGPLHVGTALWCLVAFLALRRPRFGWGFAVAVVFLTAGLLGDLQMLVLGVLPVFFAGLIAIARTRDWRAGLPQIAAAVSSGILAELIRLIARSIGTFHIARANPIAKLSQMEQNLKQGLHEGLSMMGVGSAYFGLGAVPKSLSYVHLISVAVVFAAMVGTVVALVWGVLLGRSSVVGKSTEAAWRLDDMLVLGVLGSAGAFVVLALSLNVAYGRYLTAGIVFGAILSGRLVGRLVESSGGRVLGRLTAAVGMAVIACYISCVALNLDTRAPVSKAAQLGGFLRTHHLRYGIGDYWSASLTTVDSSGSVEVRPVFSPDDDRLIRYDREAAATWYSEPFRFLVYRLGTIWGNVDTQTAISTFGVPSRTYDVAGYYRVMVWDHTLQLSP